MNARGWARAPPRGRPGAARPIVASSFSSAAWCRRSASSLGKTSVCAPTLTAMQPRPSAQLPRAVGSAPASSGSIRRSGLSCSTTTLLDGDAVRVDALGWRPQATSEDARRVRAVADGEGARDARHRRVALAEVVADRDVVSGAARVDVLLGQRADFAGRRWITGSGSARARASRGSVRMSSSIARRRSRASATPSVRRRRSAVRGHGPCALEPFVEAAESGVAARGIVVRRPCRGSGGRDRQQRRARVQLSSP